MSCVQSNRISKLRPKNTVDNTAIVPSLLVVRISTTYLSTSFISYILTVVSISNNYRFYEARNNGIIKRRPNNLI